jgi:hypothetical protein
MNSQGNTEGMAPNDQVSFNNYLNEQLGIDKNENIAYGGKLTEPQAKNLAKNYAKFALKKKMGDSKRVVSKVKIQKEREVGPEGYFNGEKVAATVKRVNTWGANDTYTKGAKDFNMSSQDPENPDAKSGTYWIRRDAETGKTYIGKNKKRVDDMFHSEELVTPEQALKHFGITIKPPLKEKEGKTQSLTEVDGSQDSTKFWNGDYSKPTPMSNINTKIKG